MAVLAPFRFDIQQGNPLAAYQAGANIGLQRQRNRMADLAEGRAQRQEEREIAAIDQATRLRAVQDTARFVSRIADLPPEQQTSAWMAARGQLASIYGDDAVSTLPEQWSGDLVAQTAGYLPEAKPDATARKIALAEQRLGRPLNEDEILQVTGAAPRGPLVQNIVGQPAPRATTRAPTPEELKAAGYPEDTTGLVVDDEGNIKRAPETVGQREAREARTRAAKERETLTPVIQALETYQSILNETGAEAGFGPDARRLEAAYQYALLKLKEAENLGVLSGPDLEILQSVLTPPTGIGAKGAELYTQVFGGTPAYQSSLQMQLEGLRQRMRGGAVVEEQETQRHPRIVTDRGMFPEGVPQEIEGSTVIEYIEDEDGNRYVRTEDGSRYRMVD